MKRSFRILTVFGLVMALTSFGVLASQPHAHEDPHAHDCLPCHARANAVEAAAPQTIGQSFFHATPLFILLTAASAVAAAVLPFSSRAPPVVSSLA